ncbi:MAG: TolC family protein [Akkermansiaceae bacterium]|jgi:NodT family efflux transporter outer membrane factor (OMF) lipoprotein
MKILYPIAVVILAGCTASVPDSRLGGVEKAAPKRWAATREGKAGIDTKWVSRIGGSEADALVSEALRRNPDMRVAAERVNRAIGAARTAGAAMRPQISAGLNGARQKQIFIGLPIGNGNGVPSAIFENFGANLTVGWEPDVWGFRRAGQASLIADAQAQGNVYRAAKASLAAQVMRAWLALAEANEQIALATETRKLLESTRQIVRERFDRALAGDGGSAAELRLAESEIGTNEALLAQRKGEREQAIRQLEVLLGRYPAGLIKSNVTLPGVPPMPPSGLPSELLLRRPDILEAERRFASSGQLVKQAKLAFYPSFSITGSAGTTTGSVRDILNSDFGVWSLAGGLTQPIWQGGRLRSELERLKSDDRIKLSQLQSTVLKAFGEVEQALVAERFLVAREKAIAKALKAAKEATISAADEYSSGIGDSLTLITAQSNQISLASQKVTLKRLRLDNRITLHLALGGDYRPRK